MNKETKEKAIRFLKNNWFKLFIIVWLFLALILSVSGEFKIIDKASDGGADREFRSFD